MKDWTYRLLWYISWPFVSLWFPRRSYGRENIPEGPVLICANHSGYSDPFFIIYAVGTAHRLYFMAKAELFRIPVIAFFMKGLGMVPVDRNNATAGVRAAMKYLKAGHKVAIFPEGARIFTEEESVSKTGAVRLAVRMDVPVVPVYIPRNKKVFRRNLLVIGKPYRIEADKKTAKPEDYERLTDELMEKIRLLGEEKA